MAERPVFLPSPASPPFVRTLSFALTWHGGFSASQKQRNVVALHAAAMKAGVAPLLEVSTKSGEKLGQRLSAFSLQVKADSAGSIPLECAYQGSKVFESGGPFTDLFSVAHPRDAKRDPRLLESGRLIGFEFNGEHFPLEPKTAFYDWLYINAIFDHRDWLRNQSRFCDYVGFTDIEFNPARSINCQARACALFAALMGNGLLEQAVESPTAFLELMRPSGVSAGAALTQEPRDQRLFP